MGTREEYRRIIEEYNRMVARKGFPEFAIPLDEPNLEGAAEAARILSNMEELEALTGKRFPQAYKEYLTHIGCCGFIVGECELGLYGYRDLLAFNIGKERYEEMRDYLIFGEDAGSDSWFFDCGNKMGMGSGAVFIVDRGYLEEDGFVYRGKDFKEAIERLATETELKHEYFLKKVPPTEEETGRREALARQFLERIEADLSVDAAAGEIARDVERIKRYRDLIYEVHTSMLIMDEGFADLWELEKGLSIKLPLSYLVLLKELRGGSYNSRKYMFSLSRTADLLRFNIGKHKKKILEKHLVIGMTYDGKIFMDVDNNLGKGQEALFYIEFDAEEVGDAVFLARDFVDLFRMLAEDGDPNITRIGGGPAKIFVC
jgi:hypothetical protein